MKEFAPVLLGLLNMVGCSVGKPTDREVALIESITARSACVGSLDRWHREFAFQKRGRRINKDLISVTYTRAGHRGLLAGRYRSEPGRDRFLDHAQFPYAGGEFDRVSRQFVSWNCGCNGGPFSVQYQTECKSNGS